MIRQAELLYQEAQNLSEQAIMAEAKRVADVDYKALYEKAFQLKREAALLMSPQENNPMHRTWMMNAAASLAYRAGKYQDAEETIALCRTLDPDDYIANKLDELEALVNKAKATADAKNGSLHIQGVLTAAD